MCTKSLMYVSLLLLWSSYGHSNIQQKYGLTNAFSKVEGFPITSDLVEIKNRPANVCQGPLPICYGAAASCMFNEYTCRVTNIKDCANQPKEKLVSPFSSAAWIYKNNESKPAYLPSSYTNINFSLGHSPVNSLINSSRSFTFKPDSCYPIDKIANNYTSRNFKSQIAKLQTTYKHEVDGGSSCATCLVDEIKESLGISVEAEAMKAALQKKTFEEFLYKIIFDETKCESISIVPKPTVGLYPDEGDKDVKRSDLLTKSKEILTTGKPLLLGDICLQREGEICKSLHAVVITGYKLVCKDSSKTNCRPMVKVQNSWCADFDEEFGPEPWVDGKSLVDNIDKEPIDYGKLSWLNGPNGK